MVIKNRMYEIFHIIKYSAMKNNGNIGGIVFSVDFELINDNQTNKREIEGLKALTKFSSEFNVPMTFAIVGKILEKNNNFIDIIMDANRKNDIGSHSYSHLYFNNIDKEKAENEILKSVEILKNNGINPESFIFPGNIVKYLDILYDFGFKSFRSFKYNKHILAVPKKEHGLWNIAQSMFISSYRSPSSLSTIAKIAARKKMLFHIWCHPYNWGLRDDPYKELVTTLGPLVNFCKKSNFPILTMKDVVYFCEKII